MQELIRLRRRRPKILFNLLPPEIAEKESQSLYHQVFEYYYDRDQYNLDKYKYESPRLTVSEKAQKIIQDQRKKIIGLKKVFGSSALQAKPVTAQYDYMEKVEEKGDPIQFEPCSFTHSALYSKGCLTCGKQNIIVKYYGERHICLHCRKKIKTNLDDPALIFLDENGDIVCLGQKFGEKQNQSKFYHVPPDQLKIFEYRCFATLAGENELIIILHDQQQHISQNRDGKQTLNHTKSIIRSGTKSDIKSQSLVKFTKLPSKIISENQVTASQQQLKKQLSQQQISQQKSISIKQFEGKVAGKQETKTANQDNKQEKQLQSKLLKLMKN